MTEALRKKYIPMTETTYYTLLSVTVPRHGYAIIQYVNGLTKGRILLGTGTLYTMVGRLVSDGIIVAVPMEGKKAYQITGAGLELLREETLRLEKQLEDGRIVLNTGWLAAEKPEVAVDGMETAGLPGAGAGRGGTAVPPVTGCRESAHPAASGHIAAELSTAESGSRAVTGSDMENWTLRENRGGI